MEEKIEVRANFLGDLLIADPHHHLYIVYTDNTGTEYYLRGGPSDSYGPGMYRSSGELSGGSSQGSGSSNSSRSSDSSFGRPYGNIQTEYGLYADGTPDWVDGLKVPTVVVAKGADLSQVYEALKIEIDLIEAAGIRYNPITQNSNSVVTTALKNVGIEPQLPLDVWAPASETYLIDENGDRLRSSVGDREQTLENMAQQEAHNETASASSSLPADAYEQVAIYVRADLDRPDLVGVELDNRIAQALINGGNEQTAARILSMGPNVQQILQEGGQARALNYLQERLEEATQLNAYADRANSQASQEELALG